MNPGELNKSVTITTVVVTTVNGRSVETTSTSTAYFKVTQIDGTRYLKEDELIDKAVYKFEGWDNSYSDNMTLVYDGMTFKPVRPIKHKTGPSNLTEVEIIASTKK